MRLSPVLYLSCAVRCCNCNCNCNCTSSPVSSILYSAPSIQSDAAECVLFPPGPAYRSSSSSSSIINILRSYVPHRPSHQIHAAQIQRARPRVTPVSLLRFSVRSQLQARCWANSIPRPPSCRGRRKKGNELLARAFYLILISRIPPASRPFALARLNITPRDPTTTATQRIYDDEQRRRPLTVSSYKRDASLATAGTPSMRSKPHRVRTSS